MLKIFLTRMYFLVDIYHWEIFTGRWKNSDKFSEVTDAYFENVENRKIFVQNGMRCRIHIFFSLVWFEPIFRFYAPQTSNETERGFKDDFNKIKNIKEWSWKCNIHKRERFCRKMGSEQTLSEPKPSPTHRPQMTFYMFRRLHLLKKAFLLLQSRLRRQ